MSLFDFMGEEEKKEFEVHLPDVGEYEKEELLSFEKKFWASISAAIRWKNTRPCGGKTFLP